MAIMQPQISLVPEGPTPFAFVIYTICVLSLHSSSEFHPASPNPAIPKITARTAHRTTTPTHTSPAAPKYPQPSNILRASQFCTATMPDTPVRTQSMPWLADGDKKPVENAMLEELWAAAAVAAGGARVVVEAGSSYFQTTIKMGKRDMQDETTRAVEMAFGVGPFGECEGRRRETWRYCARRHARAFFLVTVMLMIILRVAVQVWAASLTAAIGVSFPRAAAETSPSGQTSDGEVLA